VVGVWVRRTLSAFADGTLDPIEVMTFVFTPSVKTIEALAGLIVTSKGTPAVNWVVSLNVFSPDAVWLVVRVITSPGGGYGVGPGGYGKKELNNDNNELYFELRV
jgi:hypothetical protein